MLSLGEFYHVGPTCAMDEWCARAAEALGLSDIHARTKSEVVQFLRHVARSRNGRRVVRAYRWLRPILPRSRYYKTAKRRRVGEPPKGTDKQWARALRSGYVVVLDHARTSWPPGCRAFVFRVGARQVVRHENPDGRCYEMELVPGGPCAIRGARAERVWLCGPLGHTYVRNANDLSYFWGVATPAPSPLSSPLVKRLLRELLPRIRVRDLVHVVAEFILADAVLSHCSWIQHAALMDRGDV